MLIKLIEIHNTSGGSKSVRELYINSSNIVSVTEETHSAILEEAKLLGFSDVAHFSSVIIQEGNRTKTITEFIGGYIDLIKWLKQEDNQRKIRNVSGTCGI